MKLPEKLEKKRDELNTQDDWPFTSVFDQGFNACAEELLPLLKEFMSHYEQRKITNGFHDLLAAKIIRKLGKL